MALVWELALTGTRLLSQCVLAALTLVGGGTGEGRVRAGSEERLLPCPEPITAPSGAGSDLTSLEQEHGGWVQTDSVPLQGVFCLHQHTWTQTGAVLKQEGLANICAVGKHVGAGGGELALTGNLVALLPSPEVWSSSGAQPLQTPVMAASSLLGCCLGFELAQHLTAELFRLSWQPLLCCWNIPSARIGVWARLVASSLVCPASWARKCSRTPCEQSAGFPKAPC